MGLIKNIPMGHTQSISCSLAISGFKYNEWLWTSFIRLCNTNYIIFREKIGTSSTTEDKSNPLSNVQFSSTM
jgi:hypothetical protein